MAPNTDKPTFVLPTMVVGQPDLGRLLRELELLDNQLLQLGLRKDPNAAAPKTGYLMKQIIDANKIDILDGKQRENLRLQLETVKDKAPTLHISFSADPTTEFTQKIMVWLRREIHPQVLLTIGLQPTIGAGCIVRSTNKYFDCSLRHDFLDKRDLLLEKIVEGVNKPQVAPVASSEPEPVGVPA